MSPRELEALRIGTLHSQLGESDGVSIVIGQIVAALQRYAGLPPESLSFACGRCGDPGLAGVWQDQVLWHRDPLLLQHTRVVARKRIDQAIDFAFALAARLAQQGQQREVFLIVSGPSGDEPGALCAELEAHLQAQRSAHPACRVELVWGEGVISAERGLVDGRKRYAFAEIPGVVAAHGGLGAYFSEVEGFGNNLLEMISLGLPVVVRRYPVLLSDIAPYGFELPGTDDSSVPAALVDQALALLDDPAARQRVVQRNLALLRQHLGHPLIPARLAQLWRRLEGAAPGGPSRTTGEG